MGIKRIMLIIGLLLYPVAGSGQNINIVDGHEYVDLGISVNWATYNIGSNKPEEYGDYFAWGETYSKSSYNKITYIFSGEKEGIEGLTDYTKYIGRRDKNVLGDSVLVLSDDVAHVQWGGRWRMPTKEEIQELVESCDWSFCKVNDVIGCWATSKINGNKIFFPLAGYIYDDVITNVGQSGKYWSSELRPDMCFESYQLWISYKDEIAEMDKKSSIFLSDDGYRENGRSVRAVFSK